MSKTLKHFDCLQWGDLKEADELFLSRSTGWRGDESALFESIMQKKIMLLLRGQSGTWISLALILSEIKLSIVSPSVKFLIFIYFVSFSLLLVLCVVCCYCGKVGAKKTIVFKSTM